MRALIKLSLLTLLCSSAVSTMSAGQAWAGDTGTTSPDSGGLNLDGSFAPGNDDDSNSTNNDTTAAINSAISVVLESIETSQSVTSPTGDSLPLSPSQLATIVAALTATGAETEPALAALEQQLATELGVLGIDISILSATPDNLTAAIAAANAFINGLSSEQLAAALKSPTFVVLRAILAGANNRRGGIASGGGATTGIPLLSTP